MRAKYASSVSCRTRVLIAGQDEVVGPAHGWRLVEAFTPGVANAVEVPGAGHNTIQLWPMYEATIGEFMNSET